MRLWLQNVEVAGQRADVEVARGRVVALHPAGGRVPVEAEHVVDGAGGALLPGLHDHHMHLLALAAMRSSVDCAPAADLAALGDLLRADRHPDGWIRAVGYDEERIGRLDRRVLDALVGERPVRVQHRSGALWVLNSSALQQVEAVLGADSDVELDAEGRPNGRLWRYDSRLSAVLPRRVPDLAALGRELRSLGLTGVTDATPDLDPQALELLRGAVATGEMALEVTVLAQGARPEEVAPLRVGPAKLLLADHDLPSVPWLSARIRSHHGAGRPVAVHCVTAESLVLTLAALEEAGVLAGDRIEHASVVPFGLEPELARLGLRVVTQPGFLSTRGERYRAEVEPSDLPMLYPVARLLAAGVPTVCSSDAPFGVLDPWQVIAAARDRRTEAGLVLGESERVGPEVALSGYLAPPADPGGEVRRVAPGERADLLLLAGPLAAALATPDRGWVRTTFRNGQPFA
ncbi:amidohydrolase family protein [Nocardioides dubius]|uniref:Amidohydrolase family protein n=1 Tax=Nocardioides dubius TaxID=317019 RepID=A0ABP4EJA3_9ACTN